MTDYWFLLYGDNGSFEQIRSECIVGVKFGSFVIFNINFSRTELITFTITKMIGEIVKKNCYQISTNTAICELTLQLNIMKENKLKLTSIMYNDYLKHDPLD